MALWIGGALRRTSITCNKACKLHLQLSGAQKRSLSLIRDRPVTLRKALKLRGPTPSHLFTPAFTASQCLLSTSTHQKRSNSTEDQTSTSDQQHHISLIRNLMRLVAHPVAIITSTDSASSGPVTEQWRGATVSSFNTVTFTPEPIISFNVKRQSATFTAITNSKLFNVHLLSGGAEAERIAMKFASGNVGKPFHNEEMEVESFIRRSGGPLEEAVGRPPVIHSGGSAKNETGGAAFRFLCEHMHDKTVDIGDHVVVFGKVIEVEEFGLSDGQPCLVYVDRKYGRVT